jgi:CheY-like chemotaxis protein
MTAPLAPKNIVLYAEDDADDQQLVKEAFLSYAANVELRIVNHGLDALIYLRSLSPLDPAPCLIILDINMPKLDGKETLKRIRNIERLKEIPVVIFTTSVSPLDKEFASIYGAGFITKPLNETQMESITDEFIEHCAEEVRKNISRKIK